MSDAKELRKAAHCIYIAVDSSVADDIAKHLLGAANELDRLRAENARQEVLLQNLLDSLSGCNENNAEFAKQFHADQEQIAALKSKLERMENTLHCVSLASQNSMESMDSIGRFVRAALAGEEGNELNT